MTPERTGLLDEVRGFLADLRGEWPELFAPRARPAAPPPPPPAAPLPADELIAAPDDGAPLKAAPPSGDLAALFEARAAYWAPRLGVTYRKVRVKDQRTLWGSCTPDGDLNFNWRLTLAPDCVLDYLVVHELAHRAHGNHSRRFWELVERACPQHRRHRRWLRRNGEALYRAPRPAAL